ncbi:MAG: CAP domain-containing protein [Bradymonadaceae bacterium]
MPNRPHLLSLLFGLLLPLALTACGPDGDDGPIQLADTGDAPSDVPDNCSNDKTMCDGECVDLQSNIDHCGQCGNACGAGGFICSSGACQCIKSGYTNCDGKCLNLQTDSQNCGACGNACAGGERCEKGTCQTLTDIEGVVEETNRIRQMGYDCDSKGQYPGTDPVEPNSELHRAAQMHADSMAQNEFFSHTYPPPDCNPSRDEGCHDFVWRVGQTAYQGRPMGENIAKGQNSPTQVATGWAESDGHCAIMMNSKANEIGVGKAKSSNGRIYWVQVFGRGGN